MKRKPLEKLSTRLHRLFLTTVQKYDLFYFPSGAQDIKSWTTNHLANKMVKHVMDMIAEYEPEDVGLKNMPTRSTDEIYFNFDE